MAIRRPRLKPQMLDPTTNLDPYLCTMESGAMALDVLTGGNVDVWGGNLVPYCGKTRAEIIKSGTNLHNVDRAWSHWGRNLDIRTGHTFLDAYTDLRNGYWIILQGDYDQFTYATKCQDSFFGDHAIIVGPERNSHGDWLAGDPLCRNFIYIPEDQLRKYSQKLGRRVWLSIYHRWNGEIFYARVKATASSTTTIHYYAFVTTKTHLWNAQTNKWVYTLPVGTRLIVRPKQFTRGGVRCYAVSGPFPYSGGNYYVPVDHVKLGSKI